MVLSPVRPRGSVQKSSPFCSHRLINPSSSLFHLSSRHTSVSHDTNQSEKLAISIRFTSFVTRKVSPPNNYLICSIPSIVTSLAQYTRRTRDLTHHHHDARTKITPLAYQHPVPVPGFLSGSPSSAPTLVPVVAPIHRPRLSLPALPTVPNATPADRLISILGPKKTSTPLALAH
ncbi:hypothetical protein K456DRAFT_1212350 [Colletotrichum gloeosporioides 23]|nr:hypothetical protein K456DRAFT_1212350 [Colletotrichum gloeosporioides 23]